VLLLCGLPPIVFQLGYNYVYFDNPFHIAYGSASASWRTPVWQGLSGTLLSPGRGLFIYSPIYLFSAASLILSWRRCGDAILRSLSIGVLLSVLLTSKWFMWWGGESYGPRLLADLAPVFAFSLYPARDWIADSRLVRALFVLAVSCSIYAHAVGAFVDDGRWNIRMEIDRFPERLWCWTDNPLTNAAIRLATGIGGATGRGNPAGIEE
jgi:hypothetical protein